MSVTRRDFLKSALTAICLPAGLVDRTKADSGHHVVLRFAAMSDVHFDKSNPPDAPQKIHLAKSIQMMNSYSARQEYPAFDALVVAGDLSNHGVAEELYPFREILDREMKPETTRVLCMGNHEYYGGNLEFFEETFGIKANDHYVINGYHFIMIAPEKGTCDEGDYLYIRDWFAEELKKAHEAAPDRPIFVVQHYNVADTIYGSDVPEEFHSGVKDLLGVIDRYPQVIHISGHSHAPTFHPRSMWQGTFNAIGTGSMCYLWNYFEGAGRIDYLKGGDYGQEGGTFLIFEVYDDQSVLIKLYDTISDSFLDREYLLINPSDPETYIYTDKRFDTAGTPSWPENARLEVTARSADSAVLDVPAARDEYFVTYYTLTIEKTASGEGDQPRVFRFWSDYFKKNPSARFTVPIGELAAGTAYRVKVVGTNAFKKETPTALTAEFTTAEA
ncbi:MAG: metallophosphoesterase [Thermoguttaceae bacterium]|nr:metallophosphoesterase [Thermoguttaceae bacterium]